MQQYADLYRQIFMQGSFIFQCDFSFKCDFDTRFIFSPHVILFVHSMSTEMHSNQFSNIKDISLYPTDHSE